MAKIYARLIIKGIKKLDDVPPTILPEVKIALAELGWEETE